MGRSFRHRHRRVKFAWISHAIVFDWGFRRRFCQSRVWVVKKSLGCFWMYSNFDYMFIYVNIICLHWLHKINLISNYLFAHSQRSATGVSNQWSLLTDGWWVKVFFQVDENSCQVVCAFSSHCLFDYLVYCLSCYFVTWFALAFIDCPPYYLADFDRLQFLKNTITAQKQEIVIFVNCEFGDFRLKWYAIGKTLKLRIFCFNVTQRPCHWEFARKNSQRTNDKLMLVESWFVFNMKLVNFGHFGSVYFASIRNDSFLLFFVSRLMVSAQVRNDFSIILAEESPWVSDIDCVALFSNDHNNDCTGTASVKLAWFHEFLFGQFDEFSLNSVDSFDNRLFRICWKALMIDDVLMKVVSQKITAPCTSVAVINSEESWLNSIFVDVENDTDAIFIVISGNALMSIDSIRLDEAILFGGRFGLIDFGNLRIWECFHFIFLSKLIILLQLIYFGLFELFSQKGFGQNLIFSVFAHSWVNGGCLFLFGKLLIDVNKTFVGFVASEPWGHVNGFVRGSYLEFLWRILDELWGLNKVRLGLDVLPGGNVFLVGIVVFSLGDSFGLGEFIGLEFGKRDFSGIGWGDLLTEEGCAGFFVHDVE